MPTTSDDPGHEFLARYEAPPSAPIVDVELEALGSDYRATGYTTRAQADQLGERLALTPRSCLLDLGSGCGWPGLYLASRHGCRVVTCDPVPSGATMSVARARRDGIAGRHLALVASGDALPCRDRSFDAVVHTDVMC